MSETTAARAEIDADALRDPISKMQMWLLREGVLDEKGINELERKVDEEVQRAADRAAPPSCPAQPDSILTTRLLGRSEAHRRLFRDPEPQPIRRRL
jgi:TPP-dependent pyruvate/acetoin dehydrogenase alpha subunit